MDFGVLLLLIAAHFLGDFAFQSNWMAEMKATSWEVNAYHAFTYTATIYIVAFLGGVEVGLWFYGAIFLSHLLIDPLKAMYKVIKPLWLDQALHIGLIYLFYLLAS